MYDIIGDIHGHAAELVELLGLLGYREQRGMFRHPTRTAVFVGDFVDRGPQIREVLSLVRPMQAAGSALAVMGNHEFNALAYHTPDRSRPGQFLRPHTEKNQQQHRETLEQVPAAELKEHLDWFRSLPMWLELEGLRVVHACWDFSQMRIIEAARGGDEPVSADFLHDATRPGTQLFAAIEDVLKGKEVPLPNGAAYRDKDGHLRTAIRIKWYASAENQTFASYALTAGDGGMPAETLPPAFIDSVAAYPEETVPVFFGHYWLQADRPHRLARNVACLDFSVAKGGCLCAYRWDGEREVSNEKFVSVPAKQIH